MQQRSDNELLGWLDRAGAGASGLTRMAGDVSHRAYYRVRHKTGESSILAVYPPEMRSVCTRFAATARLLRQAGVRVPRILIDECSRGLALLEDVGDETLYDLENHGWPDLEPWIERAASIVEALATIPADSVAGLNPPLNGAMMRHELDQTWELLLDEYGLAGDGARRARLQSALEGVCARLDAGPLEVCHRDFMARNLVPQASGDLAVLDHQDLRLGPRHYDLASLLNDSLFAPTELEERLLGRHLTGEQYERSQYRRCVVQRTLKASGTFAAFARRGIRRHLVLIRPSLERAALHLRRLPEGEGLDEDLFAAWSSFDPAV